MKTFNKILLSSVIIFIIALLILFILGRIEREGYLSGFYINIHDTLELNNIDVEDTKKLFYVNNELDYSLLTNYIFTNSNISIYSYNFRISYYSKVFRNSDIYGVYLTTNSLPNYIKDVKFGEKGSPFGVLSSDKIIKENIDNIQYSLKIKSSFYIIILLVFIFLSIFVYLLRNTIFSVLLYRIKNINRYVYILIIFLCFLIMPNIIYKVFYNKFDHINYENRVFSSKPILDIKHLDKYPKEYESYFNDYVSFRNELVQLKNIIDIFFFKHIHNDRVLLGKDNWLFYKTQNLIEKYIGLDSEYFTKSELEQVKYNLLHFNMELKKYNVDFILMICNDKQFIYTNYMPDYIKRKNIISPADKLVDYISNNTNIKLIYTKNNLLKYKDKYQLYFKYDTHWNYSGAYLGYIDILDLLGIEYNNIDSVNILLFDNKDSYKMNYYKNIYNNPYNDMSYMLALNKFEFYNNDKYPAISNYLKENFFLAPSNTFEPYFKSFSICNNSIKKKVMFIRDSYMNNMIDYVGEKFTESIYYDPTAFSYNSLLKEKPDVIVLEIIERDLKNRLLNILPNYKIEEINKDLQTNFIASNN